MEVITIMTQIPCNYNSEIIMFKNIFQIYNSSIQNVLFTSPPLTLDALLYVIYITSFAI